jgi:hypothetical protein
MRKAPDAIAGVEGWMLAWFRDLTAKERRTMLACFGG